MSSNGKPIIGITMGEPAGIGPEICGRALWHESVYEKCNPVIIGEVKTIEHSLSFVKDSKDFPIVSYSLDEIPNINYKFGEIAVIDLKNTDPEKVPYGTETAMGGKAAGEFIKTSIDLAMENKIDAVVSSSELTTQLILDSNIRVIDLKESGGLPIYIDGADESNANKHTAKVPDAS